MELNNSHIIKDDNPLIRTRSENVSLPLSEEDRELLQAMYDYVKDSQSEELCEKRNLSPAVGIAAIQVGVPKKMITVVIAGDEETPETAWALANPKIISKSVQKVCLEAGEGCLSVPGAHPGIVERPNHIRVKAYDLLTDSDVVFDAEGFEAIVLQHEIDHLSGKLFYDHINPAAPDRISPDTLVIE